MSVISRLTDGIVWLLMLPVRFIYGTARAIRQLLEYLGLGALFGTKSADDQLEAGDQLLTFGLIILITLMFVSMAGAYAVLFLALGVILIGLIRQTDAGDRIWRIITLQEKP